MSNRDPDYTFALAAKAFEQIKSLHLPADPSAFELWYTYTKACYPKLNREINDRLNTNGRITIEELDRLYEEYLSPSRARDKVVEAGSRVSREIGNAIEMLDELILSTAHSRDDCADASARLETTTDRGAVRAIADAVIKCLRDVELRHAALEQRVAVSKRELEKAQQALAEISLETGRDALTGLVNRGRFDDLLEDAAVQANVDCSPLSLLMIDIDGFKSFNDRFGHVIGDSVLRLVGSTLLQSIRGQDTAARYGGEEFAVILPNTKLEGAIAVAENIRAKFSRRELKRRTSWARFRSQSAPLRTAVVSIAWRRLSGRTPAYTRPSAQAETA
jgi:diguanylate cyclase